MEADGGRGREGRSIRMGEETKGTQPTHGEPREDETEGRRPGCERAGRDFLIITHDYFSSPCVAALLPSELAGIGCDKAERPWKQHACAGAPQSSVCRKWSYSHPRASREAQSVRNMYVAHSLFDLVSRQPALDAGGCRPGRVADRVAPCSCWRCIKR